VKFERAINPELSLIGVFGEEYVRKQSTFQLVFQEMKFIKKITV